MDISLDDHWASFVAATVQSGRFASASDLVAEGLRLVQQREAKLSSLKQTLADAIAEDDWLDDAEMDAALDAHEAKLRLASG